MIGFELITRLVSALCAAVLKVLKLCESWRPTYYLGNVSQGARGRNKVQGPLQAASFPNPACIYFPTGMDQWIIIDDTKLGDK